MDKIGRLPAHPIPFDIILTVIVRVTSGAFGLK